MVLSAVNSVAFFNSLLPCGLLRDFGIFVLTFVVWVLLVAGFCLWVCVSLLAVGSLFCVWLVVAYLFVGFGCWWLF